MDILAVFGRMHPMVLHLPIGLLMGLGLMEFLAARKRGGPAARAWYLLAAITAFIAAASGWRLHEEAGYASSTTMERHEWIGVGTMVVTIISCVFRYRGKIKQARWALAMACLLLLPTGHLGAEMTHGKGFLLEPLESRASSNEYQPRVVPVYEPSADQGHQLASYEQHIAPLLEARCTKCHGSRKVKGELRLDSMENIRLGGESGAILGSTAEESELYKRLLLPLEHDDHMPPESKTQLLDSEIDLLGQWLDAGAPFEEGFALKDGNPLPEPPQPSAEGEKDEAVVAQDASLNPEYLAAIDNLRAALVHVQPVEPNSTLLWIDFAAIADQADDTLLAQLLSPLANHIAELSLSRSIMTDASMEWIATLPALTHLDLANTAITDDGLQHFVDHPSLQQCILSRTKVGTSSLTLLQELPSLTHLWLWDTNLTAEDIATLREARPDVLLVAGDSFEETPLEVEPDLVFSGDAPLVDAPLTPLAPTSLQPINTMCPVSGKAVDARYTVVHEGKVIGFCCPNCPKTFWEDPSGYVVE